MARKRGGHRVKGKHECHYPEPGCVSEEPKTGLGNWFPLGQQKANLAAAAAAHKGLLTPCAPAQSQPLPLASPLQLPPALVAVLAPGLAMEPACFFTRLGKKLQHRCLMEVLTKVTFICPGCPH